MKKLVKHNRIKKKHYHSFIFMHKFKNLIKNKGFKNKMKLNLQNNFQIKFININYLLLN